MKKQTGFTLMEIVVVLIILGIIASLAAPLVLNAARSAAIEHNFANTISQGQNASTQMTHAIRNLQTLTTMTSSNLSFTDNDNNSISYTLSGSNLMQGSNILAHNVTGLSFSYYDSALNSTATPANVRYITENYPKFKSAK